MVWCAHTIRIAVCWTRKSPDNWRQRPRMPSERLGHSSVRATADVYSHAIRGRDKEAAWSWDEFMRLHGGTREVNHKVV